MRLGLMRDQVLVSASLATLLAAAAFCILLLSAILWLQVRVGFGAGRGRVR